MTPETPKVIHRVRVKPPEGVKVDWYVSYDCGCERGVEHDTDTASTWLEALDIAASGITARREGNLSN